MSRIRTVKPEFWKHEILSSLPELTHMLAAALINYADDGGYFNANPGLIKAECLPLRDPSVSIQESLKTLQKIGYLRIGTSPDGRKYGHIVSFDDHQRINRPTPSKIKDLQIVWEASVEHHCELTEESLPEGNREQGTGDGSGTEVSKTTSSHPEPAAGVVTKHPDLLIYEAYPRKEGKGAALDAIRKAIVRLKKGEDGKAVMTLIDAQRFLMRRVLEYERSPVGRQPDKTKIPHPATWFNQKRYDDDQQNWHHLNGEGNGTYQGKTEHTVSAAQRVIQAIEDRHAAGNFGYPPAGEDNRPGLPSVCE